MVIFNSYVRLPEGIGSINNVRHWQLTVLLDISWYYHCQQSFFWKPWKPVLISVSPRSLKHGNTGARGTWQNQHFQQQRAMDFSTLAMFYEHRYFENGHEMPWGWGPKHTFNGICRGFCAPSFSKLYLFEKNCFYRQFFSSVANSWNKSLSTLFFLHTYWYAWLNSCGLGRPSHKCAPCPQLINLLRSSNSTLSSLLLSSHFASELRATVFARTSCTWTIRKHINSCTTKRAQRINTYVTSCTWTKSKHLNSCST